MVRRYQKSKKFCSIYFQCYEWALRKAQQLDWSEDSAKALVMIGDELPHVPSFTDQSLFWKDELDVLSGMGVKVGSNGLSSQENLPCNNY